LKRSTWKDRRPKSVGLTLDCITSGGSRLTTANDPFHPEGSKPARVATEVARTLALLYGVAVIERACASGLRAARQHQAKRKAAKA
jgi:hypothetical protein